MRPSMLGMAISGMLVLTAFIMFIVNYQEFSSTEITQFVLLTAIAIAGHSILHAHQELHYGYNPLVGQWAVRDQPVRVMNMKQ